MMEFIPKKVDTVEEVTVCVSLKETDAEFVFSHMCKQNKHWLYILYLLVVIHFKESVEELKALLKLTLRGTNTQTRRKAKSLGG